MNRTVTLRGSQGKMVTVNVSEEVKNLPQVEVGDQVKMDYYESVAFQVMAPGSVESGALAEQAMATAEPGQKPAGAVVKEVTVTTTLEAIDRMNQTVTLKGPRGRTQTIRVRDPRNLSKVQVGDQVVITYTEALAISVEELGQ